MMEYRDELEPNPTTVDDEMESPPATVWVVPEEPVIVEQVEEEPMLVEQVEEEEPTVVIEEEEPAVQEEEEPVALVEQVEEEEPTVVIEEEEPVVPEEEPAVVEEEATVVEEEVEEEPMAVTEEQIEEEPMAVTEEQIEEEPAALVEQINEELEVDITDIYPDNTQEVKEEENPTSSVKEASVAPATIEDDVPNIIFIVPYRNRQMYQEIFDDKMKNIILCDMPKDKYKIYYSHQIESAPFNRGAMKNIGFFMVKNKYPQHYKNITLVFNDVDTTPNLPGTIPSYETQPGVVKHFYGMTHALGVIVSINAGDFESINGFPNYWTWGYEDNMLNNRVVAKGLRIDRSTFYQMNDREHIQQMTTSNLRMVNQGEFDRYARKVDEGLNTIFDLTYMTNEENGFVDVTHFDTAYKYNPQLSRNYNISAGNNSPFKVGYSSRRGSRLNMIITSEI